MVNEDWRWRMMTPAKGDYASVPLNAEGKRVAATWDPVKDEREGNECRAYGAGNIMRIPERLHITWENDNTLRMDTDAGMQTRLFHFDGSKWKGGPPQLQGDSIAAWEKQVQTLGVLGRVGGAVPGKGGTLHVVTTHMKPGYLRKNGVPYSGDAVLTEYYDRFEEDGNSYLIVTSVVDDLDVSERQLHHQRAIQARAGWFQVEIRLPAVLYGRLRRGSWLQKGRAARHSGSGLG